MNTGQPTILVLEDDQGLLLGVRDILTIQGYNVLTATNGREGLAMMEHSMTLPDLIVSDIMMPEMDGYQFLEAVRKRELWTTIPFIFLTAKGERKDIMTGKLMGADDYLPKPFDAEELMVAVSAKLRRRQQLDRVQNAQISEIKRRILTILHHEFRTPLTYVVAYSDMLNREFEGLSVTDMRDFLAGINSGAERLRRLVENFIFLVELETGEAQETYNWRHRQVDDLRPVFVQAVAHAQSFADERGIRLVIEPLPELPVFIGDTDYLKGAITRLLDNGIKFTDERGQQVVLSASCDGTTVYICVRDFGRGIPPREMDLIFELFYQIDRKVREDQGAGAGLPIVKRIVDMHGGRIEVESEEGAGSAFTICLPIQKV